MTPLEYLYRVVVHLVALGGLAGLVFVGARALRAVRFALAAGPDGGGTDR